MQYQEKEYPLFYTLTNEWSYNTIDLILLYLSDKKIFKKTSNGEFFSIDLGCKNGEICKNIISIKNATKKFAIDCDAEFIEDFKKDPQKWILIKADIRNLKKIIEMLKEKYALLPEHTIITANEVLEHLSEEDGKRLLEYITKELKPMLCIASTPNGYFRQTPEEFPEILNHSPQNHLCGWEEKDFHSYGFHTFITAKRVSPDKKFNTHPYALVETIFGYYCTEQIGQEEHDLIIRSIVSMICYKDMKDATSFLTQKIEVPNYEAL